MQTHTSLLEELRTRYEALPKVDIDTSRVDLYAAIDAHMRMAYGWLEKAALYLGALKPPIRHSFDLGHGFCFESPRFERGSVRQHPRRVAGRSLCDEIVFDYQIAAARPLIIEVTPGGISLVETALEAVNLRFTSGRLETKDGTTEKYVFAVPPSIPAAVAFRVDWSTGRVLVTLENVDRFDRVTLAFPSEAISEASLEDLIRLILGENSAFLHRAPLAGVGGTLPAMTVGDREQRRD
jgi:hypothetical protein